MSKKRADAPKSPPPRKLFQHKLPVPIIERFYELKPPAYTVQGFFAEVMTAGLDAVARK